MTQAAATLQVHTVTEIDGVMKTTKIGEYRSVRQAFAAAEKAAGKGAKFFTQGVDKGFYTEACTAWIA